MRSALAHAAQKRAERRQRSNSISTVPPAENSAEYDHHLAAVAASILYRSPLPSQGGRPIYILNAAAFPDASEIDYDSLLSYVLARLPGEDELLSGTEYEIVFFAGGQPESATAEKKEGPGMGWYLQAYHVLSRALRKKLQRLYIVHPRTWVRVLVGVFGTIVSPKFRRKIIHVNTLSALALHIPLEKLLIPPAVYLHDRKLSPDIYVPFASGRRAFGVQHPLPKNINTGETRLPRVLRETTRFLLDPVNIKTEGIFRIPPNSTLSGVLKEAYDRGQHFIIWKERDVVVVDPGIEQSSIDEVRVEDAYGVHLAASLIKQWYRDLREPIFPELCYAALKEKYTDPDAHVTPEDLVEMVFLESEISPLSKTSREVLTRHLLPLLSQVAEHEPQNKMSAENLAIVFSMCMVCGSNQMEDAKMSSIVKRILAAAIEMWPQLKEGMEIPATAFAADLSNPKDPHDYEDPLEEQKPPRQPLHQSDDDTESSFGHRIQLEDSEMSPVTDHPPTMSPQMETGSIPKRAPTLPPRPAVMSAVPPVPPHSEPASAVPRRKPAPPIAEPPRYSTLYPDAEDHGHSVADSPTSYVQADGFGPPRRSPWSYDEVEKKGFSTASFPEPTAPQPALNLPKRKALSAEQNNDRASAFDEEARGISADTAFTRLAAQRAAGMPSQQSPTSPTVATPTDIVQSPETVLSEGDGVFRKPSWPASAKPQSLAKPVLPQRQHQTVPIINVPTNGSSLKASTYPKPRAPSPGLLKRVASIEGMSATNPIGDPLNSRTSTRVNKLNLRQASVDDLKRLYEERVSTAKSLIDADNARKGSMSSD